MRLPTWILLSVTLFLSACGGRSRRATVVVVEQPRLTSVLVEVYDPVTNLAWENVSVRVVEADQEWSGCTCVSPYFDWFLTDSSGRVLINEYLLADAEVGFFEDSTGAAQVAAVAFVDGAENRVIILSDGDANVGRTSHEALLVAMVRSHLESADRHAVCVPASQTAWSVAGISQ